MALRPTLAPPGRLARLGLVVDPAYDLPRAGRVSDLAGVHAVWLDGDAAPLGILAAVVHRARVGVILPTGAVVSELPALLTAAAPVQDRLEVTLRGDEGTADAADAVAAVRSRLPGPVGVEVTTGAAAGAVATLADDLVVRAGADSDLVEQVGEVRRALADADRPPGGIAVVVGLSIGRTRAEARARAELGTFARVAAPESNGIFGTLDACQQRVVELVHAGVTDLRCVPPATPDLGDVVAQLTAVTVGTPDVLRPGTPRSNAPDPPVGWGGRPRFR